MKKIITHDGTFHTDDVFAVATLTLALEPEEIEVVRTRDEDEIADADYVVDVGGEYNPETNRFDHHQPEGAGKRPEDPGQNGIPYASFGLVWRHFGERVCGSEEIVEAIDQRLVQPIDALDNGVEISKQLIDDLRNYSLHSIVSVFRPTWRESAGTLGDRDETFEKLVGWAQVLLEREVTAARDILNGEQMVREIYEGAEDKRLIVLPQSLPWGVLGEHPEPLFVVYPKDDGTWSLKCVRKDTGTFENRRDLPEAWAGLRDEGLQTLTGVPDAVFAHRGRFMAIANSEEGIMELARQALEEGERSSDTA